MSDNSLKFPVHSGGSITIDLARCQSCATLVCIGVCQDQGGPLVLNEARGVPGLRWALDEIARGGCVECLGCELACELDGRRAVTVCLPLARFDEYLDSLAQTAVYHQSR